VSALDPLYRASLVLQNAWTVRGTGACRRRNAAPDRCSLPVSSFLVPLPPPLFLRPLPSPSALAPPAPPPAPPLWHPRHFQRLDFQTDFPGVPCTRGGRASGPGAGLVICTGLLRGVYHPLCPERRHCRRSLVRDHVWLCGLLPLLLFPQFLVLPPPGNRCVAMRVCRASFCSAPFTPVPRQICMARFSASTHSHAPFAAITLARTHTRTHARAHTRTHAHTHTRTHAHTRTRTHARAHTRTHAHAHTCAHAHTLTRTRAHTHTHARARTHTHNHTQSHTIAHTQITHVG